MQRGLSVIPILANISSFLCLYFRLFKKTRGLRANHKHSQNMHLSRSAVYQGGVGTMVTGSALCWAVWWQLREGSGDTATAPAAHSLAVTGTLNPTLLLAARPKCPTSALLSLHGSPGPGRIWITILRVAGFSSRAWGALSWCCWILPTADPVQELYFWQTFRRCYLFSSGYQMKYLLFHLAA